jgi:ATPase complex subunit ATP10
MSLCLVRSLIRHQKPLVCFNRPFYSTGLRGNEVVEPTNQGPLQVDIEGPDEKPGELRLLNRPLGVRERPTTIVKTRTERMKELLDSDKRMEQRRHLYVPRKLSKRGILTYGWQDQRSEQGIFP